MDYSTLTDTELCVLAKTDKQAATALIKRLSNLMRWCYWRQCGRLPHAVQEDLRAEHALGVWEGILKYDPQGRQKPGTKLANRARTRLNNRIRLDIRCSQTELVGLDATLETQEGGEVFGVSLLTTGRTPEDEIWDSQIRQALEDAREIVSPDEIPAYERLMDGNFKGVGSHLLTKVKAYLSRRLGLNSRGHLTD